MKRAAALFCALAMLLTFPLPGAAEGVPAPAVTGDLASLFGFTAADVVGGVFIFEDGLSAEIAPADLRAFVEVAALYPLRAEVIPDRGEPAANLMVIRTAKGNFVYLASASSMVWGRFGGGYLVYRTQGEVSGQAVYGAMNRLYGKYSGLAAGAGAAAVMPSREALRLPGNWADGDVAYAAGQGILPYELAVAYGDAISREEFCHLIGAVLAGLRSPGAGAYTPALEYELTAMVRERTGDAPAAKVDYTDGDSIRTAAVGALTALGIVSGRADGKFDPRGALTREEAAKILCQAASLYIKEETARAHPAFADEAAISAWAKGYVGWAANRGIMLGEDGAFHPSDKLTRAQAIVTARRLYDLLHESERLSDEQGQS